MMMPSIMLAIKDPCNKNKRKRMNKTWSSGSSVLTDTHWSEDHVQGHGDVKVESVVIDHAHSKEHGNHDHIVTEKIKKTGLIWE